MTEIDVESAGTKGRRAISGELLQILQQPVEALDISAGSYNAVKNANIATIAELATKSEADILGIVKFGQKSLNNINGALETYGLTLGSKFFDSASGRELHFREILALDAAHEVERERSLRAAALVPGMAPDLRSEIAYVFREAREQMAWPMPARVQEDLARRLKLARALDEYTKG